MENHLHLIAAAADLGKEIANFKSFTARESINYYIDHRNEFVLQQFAELKLEHKLDRTYQFWQEGAHPQRIMEMEMMDQKIAYIHDNPVRRGYVDEPEHWRYSSARDYNERCWLLSVKVDW
jgi:hypothetical protein